MIIAMKGHPGTGKSTLARSISSALKCPLLDKDDIRNSTLSFQQTLDLHDHHSCKLLNELSYQVLFQIASTQLSLGLTVVIDSPLSHKTHLDRLLQISNSHPGSMLIVIECKPKDEAEWRRRLEERGAAAAVDGGGRWHKPATWRDMEKLLEEYRGCFDYDVGHVPRLVLDTTEAEVEVDELVSSVLEFIGSSCRPSSIYS